MRQQGAHSSTFLTCFSLLGLDLWLDINQQRVQREAVRQDEIANVVATDAQRLQLSGLPVLQGHFHRLQVGVHAHIHTCKTKRRNEMVEKQRVCTSFPTQQSTLYCRKLQFQQELMFIFHISI